MKRIISLCLIYALLIACTGCGSSSLPADSPTGDDSTSSAVEVDATIPEDTQSPDVELQSPDTTTPEEDANAQEDPEEPVEEEPYVRVIDPSKPMLALTFDDGPGRYSRDFADLLTRYGARATFFVLGSNVKNFADDLKYVYEQGNEIASHTMRHKNLNLLSEEGIRTEIDEAAQAIYDAIGTYPTLIRAPYGNANSKVMKVIDGPMIKWSVDTLDWQTRDAQKIKAEILEGAGDGEIILMHEIYKTSLEGLELALKELSDDGYQFVTVSELMQYRGVEPECKHYYNIKK